MKFADLVAAVAEETGGRRGEINATLKAAHTLLRDAVAADERVSIVGLGTFISKAGKDGEKRILFKPAK